MTAEFNITIPGTEIIKRLTDLEAQVRDLANERSIDKFLIDTATSKIAGLIDRVDSLTDFVNGKIDHAPNYPANDPEPPVDTSWHPFNFSTDLRPDDDKRIVAMTRSGLIDGPFTAQHAHWDERGVMTIVAWRYAKEGE